MTVFLDTDPQIHVIRQHLRAAGTSRAEVICHLVNEYKNIKETVLRMDAQEGGTMTPDEAERIILYKTQIHTEGLPPVGPTLNEIRSVVCDMAVRVLDGLTHDTNQVLRARGIQWRAAIEAEAESRMWPESLRTPKVVLWFIRLFIECRERVSRALNVKECGETL